METYGYVRNQTDMPIMDQLLLHLKNTKIFSRLGIKNAFHQIKIMKTSRYNTTFITSKGGSKLLDKYMALIDAFSLTKNQCNKYPYNL